MMLNVKRLSFWELRARIETFHNKKNYSRKSKTISRMSLKVKLVVIVQARPPVNGLALALGLDKAANQTKLNKLNY